MDEERVFLEQLEHPDDATDPRPSAETISFVVQLLAHVRTAGAPATLDCISDDGNGNVFVSWKQLFCFVYSTGAVDLLSEPGGEVIKRFPPEKRDEVADEVQSQLMKVASATEKPSTVPIKDLAAWLSRCSPDDIAPILAPHIRQLAQHQAFKDFHRPEMPNERAEAAHLWRWLMLHYRTSPVLVAFSSALSEHPALCEQISQVYGKVAPAMEPLHTGEPLRVLIISPLPDVATKIKLAVEKTLRLASDDLVLLGLSAVIQAERCASGDVLHTIMAQHRPHVVQLFWDRALPLTLESEVAEYQQLSDHALRVVVLVNAPPQASIARLCTVVQFHEELSDTQAALFSSYFYSELLAGNSSVSIAVASALLSAQLPFKPDLSGDLKTEMVPCPIDLDRDPGMPVAGTRLTGLLLNVSASKVPKEHLAAAIYLTAAADPGGFAKALRLPEHINARSVGIGAILLQGPTAALIVFKNGFSGTVCAAVHIALAALIKDHFPKMDCARLSVSIGEYVDSCVVHEAQSSFVMVRSDWPGAERGYLQQLESALRENQRWPSHGHASAQLKWLLGSCSQCGKYLVPLSYCTGCRVTRYCGKDCQRADWTTSHKSVCARKGSGGP